MITELKDFPDYGVTEDGRVWSYISNKFLIPGDSGGYKKVILRVDGKRKNLYVHRLIAIAFLPNPEGKPQVNHIDGDKHNNNLANLEWNTRTENMRHARATGLNSSKAQMKPIRCIETGQIFESGREAARVLGTYPEGISHVLKGRYKHTKGYSFEYVV